MKSVVIIGAGAAGLVAAKTLLHSVPPGTFKVTILEKADRVGGLWPLDKDDPTSLLRPDMHTNLSKYTVAFSDLAWSSVNIRDRHQHTNGAKDYETSHQTMFPEAWHVGQYLQAYADMYIPKDSIRFRTAVTSAEWLREADRYAWAVKWMSHEGGRSASEAQVGKGIFDYMIIATGFFAEPRKLSNKITVITPEGNARIKMVHSTQLRSLSDLCPDGSLQSHAEKSLVVIGGGMSGAEAAALLAMQLSSAQHSPESNKDHEGVKIYHVIARPFYAVPLFLPSTAAVSPASGPDSSVATGPTFLPLDLVFYDLGRRTGPVTPAWGKVQPDKAGSTHRFLQGLIGGDQSDLGSQALVHDETQRQQPPYVGISEGYAEFVRSGAIIPLYGRMTAINENEVIVTADAERRRIGNVAAIVNATGFSPHVSISWLPKDVLDILEYDDASMRLPLLHDDGVSHPRIPNLGFVGFYEGPYWGVMEMQARTLARKWADGMQKFQSDSNAGTAVWQKLEAMRQLRDDMRKGEGIPQFWMGDYVGLMEGFATDVGINRNDGVFGGRTGPVVPARYTVNGDDKQEAERILKDLQETLRASTLEGQFIARAAFRAMQGSWKMVRTLTSLLPNFPSGTFNGVANLHPRYPTDEAFDAEYLYIEDGELVTEQGFTLKATRRYVYRYQEDTDKISAWFVKEDGKTVDYFFNEMNFQAPKESTNQGVGREKAHERNEACVAKGSHLCVDDMYESVCNFQFQGVALKGFGIKYVVNGPRKNYVSDTWYER